LETTTAAQLQTPLAAGFWVPNITAFNVPIPTLNFEDDSEFYGKGFEWVSQLFPTSADSAWEWPSFLTSQNFAQAIVFALGKYTETPASGAVTYVATPMDAPVNGVNLPAMTVLAGIRQGTAGKILDVQVPGLCSNGFTLNVQRGPGLQNTNLTQRYIGCGKFVDSAGVTYPPKTQENRLGAGLSTAIRINGVDYLANARFVDLNYEYNNNITGDNGFYPGSGSQNGFDIRGRMRYGKRTQTLSWQVELEKDSIELQNLLNGVEGPAELEITGGAIGSEFHKAQIEWPRTRHKGWSMTSVDGFVTAQVETAIMNSETSGSVTATAVTDLAGIGS
jgi:hypothetical protein